MCSSDLLCVCVGVFPCVYALSVCVPVCMCAICTCARVCMHYGLKVSEKNTVFLLQAPSTLECVFQSTKSVCVLVLEWVRLRSGQSRKGTDFGSSWVDFFLLHMCSEHFDYSVSWRHVD